MDIVRRRRGSEGPLSHLREEMDDLFARFFEDWPLARAFRGGRWWPAVDMVDEVDKLLIKAELPGLDKDDIDITVEGNTLIISGQKKEQAEEKGRDYYCAERRYGSFRRELPLPSGVDTDKIEASYRDGVLNLTLPKTERAKGKRIEIKTE